MLLNEMGLLDTFFKQTLPQIGNAASGAIAPFLPKQPLVSPTPQGPVYGPAQPKANLLSQVMKVATPIIGSPVSPDVASAVNTKSNQIRSKVSEVGNKDLDSEAKFLGQKPWTPQQKQHFDEQLGMVAGMTGPGLDTVGGKVGAADNFAQAASHVNAHVNPSGPGIVAGIKQGVGNFMSNLKKVSVDSFAPIEDTINKIAKDHSINIPATQDPRLLYNRVLGSPSIATQAIKQDLGPVLKSVGPNNLKEFDSYLAAKHSLDLEGKGISTGINPGHAKTFVDTLAPKYDAAAQAVTGFTQKVLKYVADNGLISKGTYDNLVSRYPNYVPMQRVMDEVTKAGGVPSKSVASLGKQTVVQGIKGSEKDIQSPLNSIMDNTYHAFDQVERNRTAQALANLRQYPGFSDVIKPVEDGVGKNTISVFENGTKKMYEVPQEIAETAKGMSAQQLGLVGKILQVPGRIFRTTTTSANLPFSATNLIKDQFTAFMNSKNVLHTSSVIRPDNFLKSFFDVIGNKGAYDDFLASGGGGSNYLGTGRNQYQSTISDLAKSTPAKIATTVTNPKKWLSAVEDAISTTEQTTRTQQYLGTRQALKDTGKVDPFANPTEGQLQAVKAGRQNTVDFSRAGTWGKVLNSTFVYLNPAIQGTRQMANAFKTNPAGTTFKVVTGLYTPVALTTLWNTSTPERKAAWDDIPTWEKNSNIIILPPNPTKDAKGRYQGAIKIPLPNEYAGLTVPVRAAMEHFANTQNQQSLTQVLTNTLGGISPIDFSSAGALASRAVPTALQPPLENYTNTKFFTGAPIVPQNQQKLSPGNQVGTNTPATIQALGEKLNVSPAKLNNLIAGYGGAVSQQVLNAVDTALSKVGLIPTDQVGGQSVADNLIKRFTSVQGNNTQNMDYTKMNKFAQEAADQSSQMKKDTQGLFDEMQKIPSGQRPAWVDQQIKSGRLSDKNVDQFIQMAKDQKAGLSKEDTQLKHAPTAVKKQVIHQNLDQLQSTQEKRAYINSLIDKGIINERNIDQVYPQ